jgi:hypothetical protein
MGQVTQQDWSNIRSRLNMQQLVIKQRSAVSAFLPAAFLLSKTLCVILATNFVSVVLYNCP